MKAMLTAFMATIAIAVIASFGLDALGYSSEAKTAGNAVRLDASE